MNPGVALLLRSGPMVVVFAAGLVGTAIAGDFVAVRIIAATPDGKHVAGYVTRDGRVVPESCGVWRNEPPGDSREILVAARCDDALEGFRGRPSSFIRSGRRPLM